MPLPSSNIIPNMFARVYTAPPQKLLFDMYENELTFDEAAKNLLDEDRAFMELYDDTDMMDELLGEDPMDILGNDDVEKAIYQKDHPNTSLTPYGPALSQEALEDIIIDKPALEEVDSEDPQDHMAYAERFLNDPRINLMVEAGTKQAEADGLLDNLGDIFDSFGSQLGNIGESAINTLLEYLTPDEAYAAYNEQILQGAENITKNIETGEKIDAPSLGALLRTRAVGEASFDPTAWFGGYQSSPAGDKTEELTSLLLQEFDRMISGQGTTQSFLRDVHLAFKAHPDQNLFANAMTEWMFNKDWEDKIEAFGADSETLFRELSSVFSQGFGDYTGADTSKWSGKRPVATPKPAGEIGLPLEEEQARRRQNRIDVLLDNARRAGITMTEEQAATTVDKWGPGPLTTQDITKKMQEEGVYDANAIAQLAPAMTNYEAVEESEMRKRHTRTLSKAFYEYVYSQPWGGRSEFSSIYPTMLSETKTLFLLDNYIKGLDGLTEKYGQSQRLGSSVKPSKLGDAYKEFLDEYMQNPKKYQAGAYLADRIKEINTILEKDFEYPSRRLDSAGGNWTQDELDAWKWVYPLFGADTRDASINRYNLMVMIGSQGEQGTRKDIAKFGITSNINHYTKQGYTGAEIFVMQTKRYGESKGVVQPVIHPPRPTTGEKTEYPGEGPDYGDLEARRQERERQRADYVRGHTYNYYDDYYGDSEAEQQNVIDKATASVLSGTSDVNTMAPSVSMQDGTAKPDVMTDALLQQIMQQNAEAKALAQGTGRNRLQDAAGWTPRSAMMYNLITHQKMTPSEAMLWTDKELKDFPIQPTSFTSPSGFESTWGPQGLAPTESEPFGVPTVDREQALKDLMETQGLPIDLSVLPYRGATLTQQEIDDMMYYPV